MKANIDVIYDFINGRTSSNRHLWTNGKILVNYYTTIAQKSENGIIVNKSKYSVSTSKIQSYLRGALSGKTIIETTMRVPLGTYDIGRFV